jgi:hypothetical protein
MSRLENGLFSNRINEQLAGYFLASRSRHLTSRKLVIKTKYSPNPYSPDIVARTKIIQRFVNGRISSVEFSVSLFPPSEPDSSPPAPSPPSEPESEEPASFSPQLIYPDLHIYNPHDNDPSQEYFDPTELPDPNEA